MSKIEPITTSKNMDIYKSLTRKPYLVISTTKENKTTIKKTDKDLTKLMNKFNQSEALATYLLYKILSWN